ncbi:MAG: 1-deoxy-D-xylulose-5-phosphate reductoisomerase [Chloroflexi bacterium RBG_16_56_11]|nr:MAG: 1-deoxy-D-xylulose-5-phosphate reductoisomerase [Chloroflexi bacterium RBG_16_56_11]
MKAPVKRLAVLGSTGSIGRQTLDVVRALPEHFRIVGLAAGKNLGLLARQVEEFRPDFVSYESSGRVELPGGGELVTLEELACLSAADTVVIATSGMAGLAALLAAVKAGKNIALANKESLVSAGEIIMAAADKSGARLLPVDSEHSAIWQCLNGEKPPPQRLVLTASGGPFRDYSRERMTGITVAQALEHPSWRMGKKVTIDSATLMNKGLEVIEARWLFGVPIESISVLVHPRSIVHSMVEFVDGSVKAQLGCPDMRLPIQYALSYPERLSNPSLPRIDWANFTGLAFEPPDTDRFPCLRLAIEAGRKGGTFPAVLCAADEAAVEFFLSGRIGFNDIPRLVEKALAGHRVVASPDLPAIVEAGRGARESVMAFAGGGS